ncbi:hypothetical protein Ahy_A02g007701 [Arachis hypogaea]|uniref:Uncharacterized protein n=1 Tax=Arachis hypogaea TaxID=3818 RepID=A0A445ECW4_ARAHY|nr:hypothetical protein Ahy_A02g007701 [Arachis hypogaea]
MGGMLDGSCEKVTSCDTTCVKDQMGVTQPNVNKKLVMMFLLLVWNLSLWMQQSNFTTPMQEVLCLTRGIEVRKRIQMELCTTAESKVGETEKTYPKGSTGCKVRMIASSDVCDRSLNFNNHKLNCTNSRLLKRNKSAFMCKTFQKLLHHVVRPDNFTFQEKDMRNFIDLDRRSIGKENGGKVVMDYFKNVEGARQSFLL